MTQPGENTGAGPAHIDTTSAGGHKFDPALLALAPRRHVRKPSPLAAAPVVRPATPPSPQQGPDSGDDSGDGDTDTSGEGSQGPPPSDSTSSDTVTTTNSDSTSSSFEVTQVETIYTQRPTLVQGPAVRGGPDGTWVEKKEKGISEATLAAAKSVLSDYRTRNTQWSMMASNPFRWSENVGENYSGDAEPDSPHGHRQYRGHAAASVGMGRSAPGTRGLEIESIRFDVHASRPGVRNIGGLSLGDDGPQVTWDHVEHQHKLQHELQRWTSHGTEASENFEIYEDMTKVPNIVDVITDPNARTSNVYVTCGGAASGKTTLLKGVMNRLLKKWPTLETEASGAQDLQQSDVWIPFYINCSKLVSITGPTALRQYIRDSLRASLGADAIVTINETLNFVWSHCQVALLIDDLHRTGASQMQVESNIASLVRELGDRILVVATTSRACGYSELFDLNFVQCVLSPPSLEALEHMARICMDSTPEEGTEFIKCLRRNSYCQSLARTPGLLGLLCDVARANSWNLPVEPHSLVDLVVKHVYHELAAIRAFVFQGGGARAGEGHKVDQFTPEQYLRFLGLLALYIHSGGKNGTFLGRDQIAHSDVVQLVADVTHGEGFLLLWTRELRSQSRLFHCVSRGDAGDGRDAIYRHLAAWELVAHFRNRRTFSDSQFVSRLIRDVDKVTGEKFFHKLIYSAWFRPVLRTCLHLMDEQGVSAFTQLVIDDDDVSGPAAYLMAKALYDSRLPFSMSMVNPVHGTSLLPFMDPTKPGLDTLVSGSVAKKLVASTRQPRRLARLLLHPSSDLRAMVVDHIITLRHNIDAIAMIVVDKLNKKLRNPRVVAGAIDCLAQLRCTHRKVTDLVQNFLSYPHPLVRSSCARAAGVLEMHSEAVREQLCILLDDSNKETRLSAGVALRDHVIMDYTNTIRIVKQLLFHGSTPQREGICRILAQFVPSNQLMQISILLLLSEVIDYSSVDVRLACVDAISCLVSRPSSIFNTELRIKSRTAKDTGDKMVRVTMTRLGDADVSVRIKAAEAIGGFEIQESYKHTSILTALCRQIAREKDESVLLVLRRVLQGVQRSEDILIQLMERLSNKSWRIRLETAEVLQVLAPYLEDKEKDIILEGLQDLVFDVESQVSVAAIQTLVLLNVNNPAVGEALLSSIHWEHHDVAFAAVEALRRLPNFDVSELRPLLMPRLNHSHPIVRAEAVRLLGIVGVSEKDENVLKALTPRLCDVHEEVAVNTLNLMDGLDFDILSGYVRSYRMLITELARLLVEPTVTPRFKIKVLHALRRVVTKDQRSVIKVLQCVDDDNPAVRAAAVTTLGHAIHKTQRERSAHLRSTFSQTVSGTHTGPANRPGQTNVHDQILNAVVGKLRDPVEDVRVAAAQSLKDLNVVNDTVTTSLFNAAESDTLKVQLAVTDTIGHLRIVNDTLISSLLGLIADADATGTAGLLTCIGNTGSATSETFEALRRFLQDPSPEIVEAAADALLTLQYVTSSTWSTRTVSAAVSLVEKGAAMSGGDDGDDGVIAKTLQLKGLALLAASVNLSRNPRACQAVYSALSSKHAEVLAAALAIFSQHDLAPHFPEFNTHIGNRLQDPIPEIRQVIVKAFATIHVDPDSNIARHLVRRARDNDPAVRAEAARTLGELEITGHSFAHAALEQQLLDHSSEVRLIAARALGRRYDFQNEEIIEELLEDLQNCETADKRLLAAEMIGLLRVHSDESLYALITGLSEDTDIRVRRECATALGRVCVFEADPSVYEHLKERLRLFYPAQRMAAANGLRTLNIRIDTSMVYTLAEYTKNEDTNLRGEAVMLLTALQSEQPLALNALLDAAREDSDSRVRYLAAYGYCKCIPSSQEVPQDVYYVLMTCTFESPEPEMRVKATRAIVDMVKRTPDVFLHNAQVRQVLASMLSDPDSDVRSAALHAYADLTPFVDRYVLAVATHRLALDFANVKIVALDLLRTLPRHVLDQEGDDGHFHTVSIYGPDALARSTTDKVPLRVNIALLLVHCLRDHDPRVRTKAAQGLEHLGIDDAYVIRGLVERLAAERSGVQDAARQAVQTLGGSCDRSEILNALESRDWTQRRDTLTCLQLLGWGSVDEVAVISKRLRDRHTSVRSCAASVLGSLIAKKELPSKLGSSIVRRLFREHVPEILLNLLPTISQMTLTFSQRELVVHALRDIIKKTKEKPVTAPPGMTAGLRAACAKTIKDLALFRMKKAVLILVTLADDECMHVRTAALDALCSIELRGDEDCMHFLETIFTAETAPYLFTPLLRYFRRCADRDLYYLTPKPIYTKLESMSRGLGLIWEAAYLLNYLKQRGCVSETGIKRSRSFANMQGILGNEKE